MFVMESDPKSDAPRPTARISPAVVGRAGIQLSYGRDLISLNHSFSELGRIVENPARLSAVLSHIPSADLFLT